MTALQINGALTMLSTNGDGPQLLTEAAEFLNALAQMGVQMGVEIHLRPVAPEPATYTPPARIVEHVSDSGAFLATIGAPPFSAGEPANPTPAAPAQPDAPQWNLTPHPVRSSSSATNPEWRKLSREQRHNLLHVEGRMLARKLGHAPTMAEWDASRPADYPTASALPKSLQIPWTTLATHWYSASA